MKRETFIIGDKEYAAVKIGAFEANRLIFKLQKLALPILGEISGNKNIMDMDMSGAFAIISERLDDTVMTDIVMPMFKQSQVSCVTDNIKIDSPIAIDKVFSDADGLADLYTLVFDVLKFNFGTLFSQIAARFGSGVGSQEKTASTLAE